MHALRDGVALGTHQMRQLGLAEGIAYLEIEGASGLVKAETCDQCRSYSKIVFADMDADAEVFADDLTTLTLDILVDEAGWRRFTPNPFLLTGAC
jgi:FdhE protein